MRLRKLILQGFKSFADRTEFVFDAPITGIVGPNGCGKSNVVDAFKWVLGEQSAKSLRGDAMMDVIFNGAAGRKPAGMAEVVLVFDNPRRADGTRLLNIDADEVVVGRRLFRDGTSEYQLNNQATRLKDIRELFLDTGVGVDAYSVIEQGRVSAMLEANPEERRIIFEEAAGISKFKAKKKEAQRKLEKVDQNLLRVTDIVEEVDKRLRSVRIQAGRARTFQEYSQRLRELRLTYALQEYSTLHAQLEEHASAQGRTQQELEALERLLAERQMGLTATRQEFDALSQRQQRAQYEQVQTAAALQASQQRQQYARQQLEQIAEQLRSLERDRQAIGAKQAENDQSLLREQQLLEELSQRLREQRQRIEDEQKRFHDTQLELNQIQRETQQNKAAVLDLMRRSAGVNNRLGAIEIERKNTAAQQQRLAQRRQFVLGEMQTLDAARAELDEAMTAVVAEISALQVQLEASAAEAAAVDRRIAATADQLGQAREHRSGLLSRQKLLEDLEARREGFSEGVKSVLRRRAEAFAFVRGVVADFLRVDVEHALVIEAALDGRDQMLIADSTDAVAAAGEALAELEGRVSILCADELGAERGSDEATERRSDEGGRGNDEARSPKSERITNGEARMPTGNWQLATGSPRPIENRKSKIENPPASALSTQHSALAYDWNVHPQRIRLAVDLVRFEPADAPIAHHLLGSTIVVDELADARALRAAAPPGYRYVTRDGQVLESDGTLRAGALGEAMGLISRRSELEALKLQIAEVDRRIEELSRELSAGNAQARALQEKQQELRGAIYAANTQKVQIGSRMAQVSDKQNAFRRELPVLERELQNLLDQAGRLKSEEGALLEGRRAIETEQADRQRQIEQLEGRQAHAEQLLRQVGEALTSLRVELGQVQEKQLAAQQAVQRLSAARAELAEQLERVDRASQQASTRRSAVNQELEAAVRAEQELAAKHQRLTQQIEAMAAQVTEMAAKVEELNAAVQAAAQQRDAVAQSLHELEVKLGEVRVRLEGLVQRTLDELQLDLPARWAELEQQGGYQPEQTDWNAVAEEIRQLREKLQRLGNVNLDAIGEQDELEQRQTFLAAQVNDLKQSKKQLEELIDTINKESSVRFEQTFNAVREHFQTMFRKLFGGGKADIFLETSVEERAPAGTGQVGPDGQPAPAVIRRTIDPLEAGIEIIARPPGKQPVSINQLSGGEKTMTCVALLMSIFKSKPSPFCILDEVDAALDEANNQRFNLVVQEFLDQSQFIIITHSKRTMQIADVLYGVTMQEQGVSKRVAVRFDQVDSQGRIQAAETAAA